MTDTLIPSLIIVGVLVILLGILRLRHISLQSLIFGLIGAILGLLLGALASVPLSKLPQPFGSIAPVGVSILLTLVLMGVVLSRRQALLRHLPFLQLEEAASGTVTSIAPAPTALPQILVDTSVIIDGRIADIAAAGFVPGRLVVPRFVLAELQNIADSEDAMRRGRGRRGLEVLGRLRDMPEAGVDIIDDDVPSIREVDAKLVALAQQFSCNVLTTDYNLNRVAQIQGVRVLNINELSNAIRPVVLPGEDLIVRVVQPGKERSQGVGYLADGTMIVVENGDKLIGQEVITEVTRVFQTVAGKMIFATPRQAGPAGAAVADSTSTPTAATPASHTTTASPRSQTPVTSKNDHPSDKGDKADHEPGRSGKRFGRSNRRSGRQTDIEDRIIAATNTPNPTKPTQR